MINRRLFARLGFAVSAAGLLISAPTVAGATPAASGACSGSTVITAFHFTANGVPITKLHGGTVHSGDKLEAFFTIASGCQNVPVTLVSHTMPGPTLVPPKVSDQKVFDLATATFSGGDHTLGPINVPMCFFQVDFVYGGVHGSGYHVQVHTYSSGTGGTTSCTTPPTPPPPTPPTPPAAPPPASVLPVVIKAPAASAPTPSAPVVLAQHVTSLAVTGSNIGLLLWLCFGLMLGGTLVTLASRRMARAR
jgi:hypothetical protein